MSKRTALMTADELDACREELTRSLRIGMCCDPIDRDQARAAISSLYASRGYQAPVCVFVDGPAALTVAGAMLEQLGGQLGDQLWDQLRGQLRGQLWGQHERYWVAHYAFARLLGVKYADIDDAAADAWMSVTETCGWFTPRENVCLVADRQEVQSLERGVLHRADGPAIKCRDGFEVFAWRGLRVPEWVITAPTVEAIRAEANTEIRRCAIENYGWDRYLNDLGVTPVASEADPGNPGHTLDLYDLPEDQQVYGDRVRVVVMRNASLDRDGGRRTFAETVPADIHSPVAAQAWAYDTDEITYRALERAT